MPHSRNDINAEQILAATEEVARTLMGNVVDALSTSADERTVKWTDAADAMAHLSRIREAVNNGEELVWSTVDFFLSVMEQRAEGIPVRAFVTEEVYDALEAQGAAHGMTAQGYLTALAMQSAKNYTGKAQAAVKEHRKRALLVVRNPMRAEQFIQTNAEGFTGWEITIALATDNGENLRGHTFDLSVLLDNPVDQLDEHVAVCTRNGPIVKASLVDRFDANAAVLDHA